MAARRSRDRGRRYPLGGIGASAPVEAPGGREGRDPHGGRPLRAFGKYSYAIYLLHVPCLFALSALVPATVLQTRVGYVLGLMVPGFALSFVGALGTWHLFERRLLSLKRAFEPRHAPHVGVALRSQATASPRHSR